MEQIAYEIDYEPGSMIDQWVKQGREEDIKKMLQKGFTVEQIVDILEVPEEMVLSVKEKYNL